MLHDQESVQISSVSILAWAELKLQRDHGNVSAVENLRPVGQTPDSQSHVSIQVT